MFVYPCGNLPDKFNCCIDFQYFFLLSNYWKLIVSIPLKITGTNITFVTFALLDYCIMSFLRAFLNKDKIIILF